MPSSWLPDESEYFKVHSLGRVARENLNSLGVGTDDDWWRQERRHWGKEEYEGTQKIKTKKNIYNQTGDDDDNNKSEGKIRGESRTNEG